MLDKLHQITHNTSSRFDLTTSKIWYAIILLSKQDFSSALRVINEVLSSIPPYYLCVSEDYMNTSTSSKRRKDKRLRLYAEKFMNSDTTVMERGRQAWLMPFTTEKCMTDILPLALQIEIYFLDNYLGMTQFSEISPFVILQYLAFHCYHELGQYDQRHNAIHQLIHAIVKDGPSYDSSYYHSFNIAGHCLLINGEIDFARQMFISSNQLTERRVKFLSSNQSTAATWYLQHFC